MGVGRRGGRHVRWRGRGVGLLMKGRLSGFGRLGSEVVWRRGGRKGSCLSLAFLRRVDRHVSGRREGSQGGGGDGLSRRGRQRG